MTKQNPNVCATWGTRLAVFITLLTCCWLDLLLRAVLSISLMTELLCRRSVSFFFLFLELKCETHGSSLGRLRPADAGWHAGYSHKWMGLSPVIRHTSPCCSQCHGVSLHQAWTHTHTQCQPHAHPNCHLPPCISGSSHPPSPCSASREWGGCQTVCWCREGGWRGQDGVPAGGALQATDQGLRWEHFLISICTVTCQPFSAFHHCLGLISDKYRENTFFFNQKWQKNPAICSTFNK